MIDLSIRRHISRTAISWITQHIAANIFERSAVRFETLQPLALLERNALQKNHPRQKSKTRLGQQALDSARLQHGQIVKQQLEPTFQRQIIHIRRRENFQRLRRETFLAASRSRVSVCLLYR